MIIGDSWIPKKNSFENDYFFSKQFVFNSSSTLQCVSSIQYRCNTKQCMSLAFNLKAGNNMKHGTSHLYHSFIIPDHWSVNICLQRTYPSVHVWCPPLLPATSSLVQGVCSAPAISSWQGWWGDWGQGLHLKTPHCSVLILWWDSLLSWVLFKVFSCRIKILICHRPLCAISGVVYQSGSVLRLETMALNNYGTIKMELNQMQLKFYYSLVDSYVSRSCFLSLVEMFVTENDHTTFSSRLWLLSRKRLLSSFHSICHLIHWQFGQTRLSRLLDILSSIKVTNARTHWSHWRNSLSLTMECRAVGMETTPLQNTTHVSGEL